MRPLYIFDLDGTLSDLSHRVHHVQSSRKDWDAFYQACGEDQPIEAVIALAKSLGQQGYELWIFTGRSDQTMALTESWLERHGIKIDRLQMRREGDHTHDDVLKESWLQAMSASDRARLMGVFEDRARVVQMWRKNGVQCFHVAEGDF